MNDPQGEIDENVDIHSDKLKDSLFRLSNEKTINPASIGMAISIQNMLALIDNFVQYLAIMRGSTGVIQGLIVSVKQLGTAILNPVWGFLSDTYGRRKFMALGLIISSIIAALLPFVPTAELILLLVGINAIFGTMLMPSWISWIGDRSTKANRAQTFGKISMIGSWSAMFGNLAISFYMDFTDPDLLYVKTLRFPLLLSSILGVISSILVLFLSAERPYKKVQRIERKSPLRSLKDLFKGVNDKFKIFISLEGLFYFGWAAAWPLFPYVQFGVASSWLDFAIMQLFFAIPSGISFWYGGKLADRIGYKKMVRLTRPVLVIPPITASLAVIFNSIYFIFLGNLAVGLTLGATTVSINSLIMEYAPEDNRASYVSVHAMTIGVIGFISSTIIGFILELVAGDIRPPDTLLITLLLIVASIRLFGALMYRFIPDID